MVKESLNTLMMMTTALSVIWILLHHMYMQSVKFKHLHWLNSNKIYFNTAIPIWDFPNYLKKVQHATQQPMISMVAASETTVFVCFKNKILIASILDKSTCLFLSQYHMLYCMKWLYKDLHWCSALGMLTTAN